MTEGGQESFQSFIRVVRPFLLVLQLDILDSDLIHQALAAHPDGKLVCNNGEHFQFFVDVLIDLWGKYLEHALQFVLNHERQGNQRLEPEGIRFAQEIRGD